MGRWRILSKHVGISSSCLPLEFLQEAFQISSAMEHQLEAKSNTDEGPLAAKIQFSPAATRQTSKGFDEVMVCEPGLKLFFFFN